MEVTTLQTDQVALTRVSYVDVAVPAEFVGLSSDQVAGLEWTAPQWAEDGQVRIGAAAWFAEAGNVRLAFDPLQAADAILRSDRDAEFSHQSAVADIFEAAGFARDSIDLLVMSHIEGVGMVAWREDDGSWSPFFPNARILLSDVVLENFMSGEAPEGEDLEHEAWTALVAMGVVETFSDGDELAPGIVASVRGGHCPGHTVFHFRSDDMPLTMIGHMAVSPIHIATGECAQLNADPADAFAILTDLASRHGTLIGPLWPAPGYGRWEGGQLLTD